MLRCFRRPGTGGENSTHGTRGKEDQQLGSPSPLEVATNVLPRPVGDGFHGRPVQLQSVRVEEGQYGAKLWTLLSAALLTKPGQPLVDHLIAVSSDYLDRSSRKLRPERPIEICGSGLEFEEQRVGEPRLGVQGNPRRTQKVFSTSVLPACRTGKAVNKRAVSSFRACDSERSEIHTEEVLVLPFTPGVPDPRVRRVWRHWLGYRAPTAFGISFQMRPSRLRPPLARL